MKIQENKGLTFLLLNFLILLFCSKRVVVPGITSYGQKLWGDLFTVYGRALSTGHWILEGNRALLRKVHMAG